MNTPTEQPTEAEETRRGAIIREILNLKPTREHKDRVWTQWGTKTDLGLFRTIQRIILDGE